MTYEERCLMATRCRGAGDPEWCNTLCITRTKLHGEDGFGGLWGLSDIPKGYAGAMAHNLPFKDSNLKAYIYVCKYVQKIIERVDEGMGLYLHSIPNEQNPKGCGTGKTTAACSIANEFLVERLILHVKQKRTITDIPALFVSVAKFQNTYNKQFRGTKEMQEEASRRFYTLKERMVKAELLTLDDIGIRDSTEAFKAEFYEIIDERASEPRATILTSNEPIERIAQVLDERIASRIEGSTLAIPFIGADMRKRGAV